MVKKGDLIRFSALDFHLVTILVVFAPHRMKMDVSRSEEVENAITVFFAFFGLFMRRSEK